MMIERVLAGLVVFSQRRVILVVLPAVLGVGLGGFVAAQRLGVSTDTAKTG